jgi:amino acid adenylation domain-containing protein
MDLCASDLPNVISGSNSTAAPVGKSRMSPATLPRSWEANRTYSEYPRSRCLHDLLSERAQSIGAVIAVECDGASLTYAELGRRSNQVARFLQKRGVGPDVLVGLCVDRSLEMLVGLLGILKAGGAYVPLDPSYPSERVKYVLEDAHVRVLLTQEKLRSGLPETSAELICLDADWPSINQEDGGAVNAEVGPKNLAYVIYTSGSTGKPKGVQLEHRSVVNFLYSMQREPGMTAQDILVAVTTLSFDIAGLELYLPLLAGGRLVIATREATMDGRLLMRLLEKSGATLMQATPTTWRVLLESGWQGDSKLKALVGGEALSVDLAKQLARLCNSAWNMYGPTETTIWSSVYRLEGKDEKLVPIGKPIANTTFYVLDAQREPVPDGAEGELYIGGEGLARGYFEREQMTQEKFVPDPFDSRPGARMYRTGDLARFKPDGNVEFLGRIDHQVKIRGFRIELGEIEAVLEQHSGVHQAVVVAREDNPGDKRLVAYYVPVAPNGLTPRELRQHVAKQLPDYMTPSAFAEMAKFPLTPNGKVDRKALPAAEVKDFDAATEYVAPRNPTERKLARLWEEVLGIGSISVTANFFELGGRSMLAARLFTKILREFGKELPLSTLFRSPTVELLAKDLSPSEAGAAYSTLVAIQPNGSNPPFFCVHGGAGSTLFLHELAGYLGPDQPFYGIEPEGMDGRQFQRLTVEQMAEHYLSEVRKVQPTGPYFLGGYCFGGLVAFEMARLLQQQGERAELVAMFSAALRCNHKVQPTVATPSPAKDSLGTRLARVASAPAKTARNLATAMYWKAVPPARKLTYRALFALGKPVPPNMRAIYVTETLGDAELKFRPKRYTGKLALFHGSEAKEFGPNLGWDELADHFEHYVIGDGDLDSRRDILNEPLVGITARTLASCLKPKNGAVLPETPLSTN